jgi:hypothetical protein
MSQSDFALLFGRQLTLARINQHHVTHLDSFAGHLSLFAGCHNLKREYRSADQTGLDQIIIIDDLLRGSLRINADDNNSKTRFVCVKRVAREDANALRRQSLQFLEMLFDELFAIRFFHLFKELRTGRFHQQGKLFFSLLLSASSRDHERRDAN